MMTKKNDDSILFEDVDYLIINPINEDDLCSVTMLTGPFNGVTFQFDTVKPVVLEDRTIRLHYNYHITDGRVPESDTETFHEVVGDVLYSIIKTDSVDYDYGK